MPSVGAGTVDGPADGGGLAEGGLVGEVLADGGSVTVGADVVGAVVTGGAVVVVGAVGGAGGAVVAAPVVCDGPAVDGALANLLTVGTIGPWTSGALTVEPTATSASPLPLNAPPANKAMAITAGTTRSAITVSMAPRRRRHQGWSPLGILGTVTGRS